MGDSNVPGILDNLCIHGHAGGDRRRSELRSGRFTNRAAHPEIVICNFFEQWGSYYRHGAIDRRAFMEGMAGIVIAFWDRLEPVIATVAERSGGVNMTFENFELLTVHAREWVRRHPQGSFPKGVQRIQLTDPWRDIDRTVQT